MSTYKVVEYPTGKTYQGGKKIKDSKQDLSKKKKQSKSYTNDQYMYAIHKIIDMARKQKSQKIRKRAVPEYRYIDDRPDSTDRQQRIRSTPTHKKNIKRQLFKLPKNIKSSEDQTQNRQEVTQNIKYKKNIQNEQGSNPQQYQKYNNPLNFLRVQDIDLKNSKMQKKRQSARFSKQKHYRIKSENNNHGGIYSYQNIQYQDEQYPFSQKAVRKTQNIYGDSSLPKIKIRDARKRSPIRSINQNDYEQLIQIQKKTRQKNKLMQIQMQKLREQLQQKQQEKKKLQNRLIEQMLQGKILNAIEKQPEPLQLQTFFQLERNKSANQFQTKKTKPTRQKLVIHKVPSSNSTTTFIRNYVPENKEISMKELIRRNNFQIVHQEIVKGQPELYFGEMQNNMREGYGVYINNKQVFQGIWTLNQKVKGIQKTQKGVYKGYFKNNKRHGKGQFFWSDGQYYSGQWFQGKKNGSGYWKSSIGQSYMGQWKDGSVSGYGVQKKNDNSKYEGQFLDFVKNGSGKQEFPNGDMFEGNYRNGKPQGPGTYFWKEGYRFQGQFHQGYRRGIGRIIGKKYEFEGTFINDYASGMATISYPNGDIFKGEISRNKKNGQGVLNHRTDKKIIKGIWKDNKLMSIENQIAN